MIKDKKKNKKDNAPSDKNNTSQKKGSVPQDEDKIKKNKLIRLWNGNGKIKKNL